MNLDTNPSTSELKADIRGVDNDTIKICARLCQHLYDVKDQDVKTYAEDGFHEVKPYPHGKYMATQYESTLFLAWRGTVDLDDAAADVLFDVDKIHSPVDNLVKGIAVQGKFYARANKNMTDIAKDLDDQIENASDSDGEIKRIIFCGHSLGGALAEMGRLILQAKMSNDKSLRKINDNEKIESYTIAFSAPMSISIPTDLDRDVKKENPAVKFLRTEFAPNSYNITYGTDAVSHGYSHTKFLTDFLDDVRNVKVNQGVTFDDFMWKFLTGSANFVLEKETTNFTHFRHVGTVIHVEGKKGNLTSTKYVDKGSDGQAILNDSLELDFRTLDYVSMRERFNKDEMIKHVKDMHMDILKLVSPTNED